MGRKEVVVAFVEHHECACMVGGADGCCVVVESLFVLARWGGKDIDVILGLYTKHLRE